MRELILTRAPSRLETNQGRFNGRLAGWWVGCGDDSALGSCRGPPGVNSTLSVVAGARTGKTAGSAGGSHSPEGNEPLSRGETCPPPDSRDLNAESCLPLKSITAKRRTTEGAQRGRRRKRRAWRNPRAKAERVKGGLELRVSSTDKRVWDESGRERTGGGSAGLMEGAGRIPAEPGRCGAS